MCSMVGLPLLTKLCFYLLLLRLLLPEVHSRGWEPQPTAAPGLPVAATAAALLRPSRVSLELSLCFVYRRDYQSLCGGEALRARAGRPRPTGRLPRRALDPSALGAMGTVERRTFPRGTAFGVTHHRRSPSGTAGAAWEDISAR